MKNPWLTEREIEREGQRVEMGGICSILNWEGARGDRILIGTLDP